jgi:hypothetical protein
MSRCGCDALPQAFFVDEASDVWLAGLHQEALGNWKTLRRCTSCARLFSVDVRDKYQDQVVVHVVDRARWEEEGDSVSRRKELLLRSRGGTESEPCAWAGCSHPRVRGVAYCLDHLWTSGARR